MSGDSRISPNPNNRMGIFKTLTDVPSRYRLYQHAAAYDGEDTYNEYLTEKLLPAYPDATDKYHESIRRAGRRWKGHMAERGRHHALATPEDVETWCADLLGSLTLDTVCQQYWRRINGFYSWLQAHPDHPHTYHPVLMAVARYPNSKEVWNRNMTRGNRTGGGWEVSADE